MSNKKHDPLSSIRKSFIDEAASLGFESASERMELLFTACEIMKSKPELKDEFNDIIINKKDKQSFISFITANQGEPECGSTLS